MFFGLTGWIELQSTEMEKVMSGVVFGRHQKCTIAHVKCGMSFRHPSGDVEWATDMWLWSSGERSQRYTFGNCQHRDGI